MIASSDTFFCRIVNKAKGSGSLLTMYRLVMKMESTFLVHEDVTLTSSSCEEALPHKKK